MSNSENIGLDKNKEILPLASSTWGQAEKNAAIGIINSEKVTMGEKVLEFEEVFAQKFGSKFAVMVNSGSSANLLAITSLMYLKDRPLKAGDEIIVPSLSWSTTYYPVTQCGMKLVIVDIDRETLNIDVKEIKKALSAKTKAIFVPNILGNPAPLIELKQICEEHDLYLIEDNCESMGAKLGDKFAGTFGICGTFSTYFSHHISTIEGGVVVTDDEYLYQLMLSIRSHGWTRALPKNNLITNKSENSFYEQFRFILPGYNIRPMELTAAIGLEQLKKLDGFVSMRRENAIKFKNLFSSVIGVRTQREVGFSSWFGFSLVFDNIKTRDDMAKLLQEYGVSVRPVIAGCILNHDVISYLDSRVVGEHCNAKHVHDCGLFIGNHHYDISEGLIKLKDIISVSSKRPEHATVF